MKKSIIILATLLAATVVNAQITLEKTFDGWYTISADWYGDLYHYIQSPYFYTNNPRYENGSVIVDLYDPEDFSLYKSISINIGEGYNVSCVTRNILTTDGKICFSLFNRQTAVTYIYSEDGQLVASLLGEDPSIVNVNGKYILITRGSDKTYIYSLPGNGEAQAVSTPSSPMRSARKITRDGQVLVQTDNNTYTLTGAEVK